MARQTTSLLIGQRKQMRLRPDMRRFPMSLRNGPGAHHFQCGSGAYRRGDLFKKRRILMTAWAEFLTTETEHAALLLSFRRAAQRHPA
jgi:hypothetical protein